jgi:hypothetical protein
VTPLRFADMDARKLLFQRNERFAAVQVLHRYNARCGLDTEFMFSEQ